MINKEKYRGIIQNIYEVTAGTDNESALNAVDELNRQADAFELKAVFVGHFSAGKSTLINGLIGRDNFLEEGHSPTTELATELHYTDKEEYCEAVGLNGKCFRIDLNGKLDTDKIAYLRCFVNSEQLAKLGEFTVVDTPGINSGIEKHNKAIANYLTDGSVFIFVTAAENGGLNKYELAFLREISSYSDRIAVVISKCDKLTEEDLSEVKNKVTDELDLQFIDAPVYCLTREDPMISEKIISIITAFDAQSIYDEKINELIVSSVSLAKSCLQTELSGVYLSTYSQDRDITNYSMKRKNAIADFQRRTNDIEEELVINGTDHIMQNITNALEENIGRMADAIVLGSQEGLEACVIETIRPAIIRAVGEIGQDITNKAAMNIVYTDHFFSLSQDSEDRGALDIVGDIVNKVNIAKSSNPDQPAEVSDGIKMLSVENEKGKKDQGKNNNNMYYKMLTAAIGLATGGQMTWMELIVVVLPEIIELLKLAFGESKKEKAKRQLRSVIFPQVRVKLYPQISQCVKEKAKLYLAELESNFGSQLKLIDSKIEEAHQLKETNENAYYQKRDGLEESIEKLDLIVKNMEE